MGNLTFEDFHLSADVQQLCWRPTAMQNLQESSDFLLRNLNRVLFLGVLVPMVTVCKQTLKHVYVCV